MSDAAHELLTYIGGTWTRSASPERAEVLDPASGRTLAHVPLSAREKVDAAAEAGARALRAWRATPAPDRVRVLFRL